MVLIRLQCYQQKKETGLYAHKTDLPFTLFCTVNNQRKYSNVDKLLICSCEDDCMFVKMNSECFNSISIQILQSFLLASPNSQVTLGRPCLILWMSVQKCTGRLWHLGTKKNLTHSIPSSSIMAETARPASHQLHQMGCLLTCLQKELPFPPINEGS